MTLEEMLGELGHYGTYSLYWGDPPSGVGAERKLLSFNYSFNPGHGETRIYLYIGAPHEDARGVVENVYRQVWP